MRSGRRPGTAEYQDRGWAWVILAACSFIGFIFGLNYVIGIFNVIFLEVFGESRQMTAWLGAVQSSFLSLTAPLSGFLAKRIGARLTVMVAGLLGASGFFLTCFATNFISVFITYGVMVGVANGLLRLQSVVMLGSYFKEYRNLSYGIISTFTGIGTMVFPPVVSGATEFFGWRGCMLIMAGFYLNVVLCGAVMRPVPSVEVMISLEDGGETEKEQKFEVPPQDWITGSLISLPSVIKESKTTQSCMDLHELQTCKNLEQKNGMVKLNCDNSPNKHYLAGLRTTSDIYYSDQNMKSLGLRKEEYCQENNVQNYAVTENEPKNEKACSACAPSICNRKLLFLCLNVFCFHAVLYTTFLHFPDYYKRNGISDSEMNVVMLVLGITGIVSRLVVGTAINSPDVSPVIVYMAGNGLAAIFLFLCPTLSSSYWGQIIFVAGFGLYGNVYNTIIAPVTVEVFSVEELSDVFTILLVVCGTSGLLAPPFAGWLYDISGDFFIVFILTGTLSLLSSVFLMLIPVVTAKSLLTTTATATTTTAKTMTRTPTTTTSSRELEQQEREHC